MSSPSPQPPAGHPPARHPRAGHPPAGTAQAVPPPADVAARLRAAGCVFAEDEARLLMAAARSPADLAAMVDRRAAGLPLEHVVGWAEFCGLRIIVEPGVFVPRRRTEFLVGQAAALARQFTGRRPGAAPVVVDLCCGSGALGAALAAALGEAELHAADVDPAAVRCARRNLARAGGRAYQGDLYDPLPTGLRGRVEILMANVPYIPTGDIGLLPSEARLHEPRLALDGGPDGLDVLRRVAATAPGWLAPGGSLLVETSERQAPRAAGVMAGSGLDARVARCDELSATVVIGTRPSKDHQIFNTELAVVHPDTNVRARRRSGRRSGSARGSPAAGCVSCRAGRR